LRPDAASGPEGVWLAGAWTDTGWPDTMEGAVRSGITAAEAALKIPAEQASEFAA
jgi:monoamine oxidase